MDQPFFPSQGVEVVEVQEVVSLKAWDKSPWTKNELGLGPRFFSPFFPFFKDRYPRL